MADIQNLEDVERLFKLMQEHGVLKFSSPAVNVEMSPMAWAEKSAALATAALDAELGVTGKQRSGQVVSGPDMDDDEEDELEAQARQRAADERDLFAD